MCSSHIITDKQSVVCCFDSHSIGDTYSIESAHLQRMENIGNQHWISAFDDTHFHCNRLNPNKLQFTNGNYKNNPKFMLDFCHLNLIFYFTSRSVRSTPVILRKWLEELTVTMRSWIKMKSFKVHATQISSIYSLHRNKNFSLLLQDCQHSASRWVAIK